MTETKKTTTKKSAPKKVAKTSPSDSIVVMDTHIGEPLVIRGNPTDDAVRGFVAEHSRRYIAGEPGGPSGIPAFRIFNAKRYSSEPEWLGGAQFISEIDVSEHLPS